MAFVPSFLVYGATGYTGRLVVEALLKSGLKPILAARNAAAVEAMAKAMDLRHRSFDLQDRNALDQAVTGVRLVVNLAGPFVGTGSMLAQSCLRIGAHYLDISAEIADYRSLQPLHERAVDSGVMLLPGAGFGILASDCLARHAHQRHPAAVSMQIAVKAVGGGLSEGAMRSLLANLSLPGFRREAGQLKPARCGDSRIDVDFGPGGKARCVNYPWRADLATAGESTGVPHIDSFLAMPLLLRMLHRFPALAGHRLVRKPLLKLARGPSAGDRSKGRTYCVAQTVDETGRRQSSLLIGPDAYDFTASAVAWCTRKILEGVVEEGLSSPARLFGTAPLQELPGLQLIDR